MSRLRIRRTVIATVVAASLAAGLSGCFFNPFDPAGSVEDAVEGAVEGATGGDLDVNLGELPEGFPSEVPLIDGKIVVAAGTGGDEGWFVTIETDSTDPVADATAALDAAGFTEQADLQGVEVEAVAVRTNGTYDVFVVGDQDGTVTYTVTQTAAG
ncbi:hypothetical protein ACGGZK_10715 [Agromyces sp. MMS24-K17]|uniref:hypothetical protein n=1 Tax=Agromyces sp. MMS24-K17 TaxID=3372850 RepID=UPI003754838D